MLERAGVKTLVYHRYSKESSSDKEVDEWLGRRKMGEEKRLLLTDSWVSRGWEASHTLVVALDGVGLENLVMRTVGYCALIKEA